MRLQPIIVGESNPYGGVQPIITLGAKVAAAFGLEYAPFTILPASRPLPTVLMLPHPSGLNRSWNEPGAFERTRTAYWDLLVTAGFLL